MYFGEHLTVDGFGGEKDKLNGESLVLKCLQELPGKLGMGILEGPYVEKNFIKRGTTYPEQNIY